MAKWSTTIVYQWKEKPKVLDSHGATIKYLSCAWCETDDQHAPQSIQDADTFLKRHAHCEENWHQSRQLDKWRFQHK